MSTLGSRIRTTRDRLVLSQSELAEQSGVPIVTISRLENDRGVRPQPGTIRKLAKALNVDPAWLRYGDDGEGATPAGSS